MSAQAGLAHAVVGRVAWIRDAQIAYGRQPCDTS
jgi:hypothetical protein